MIAPIRYRSKLLPQKLEQLNRSRYIYVFGPLVEFPLESETTLSPEAIWVFIDGGTKLLDKSFHNIPEKQILILGDGDSLKEQQVATVSESSFDILLETSKDCSDLEYFLSLPMENVSLLTLTGFTGGDLDHELSNLGVLYDFLNKKTVPSKAIEIQIDQKAYLCKSSSGINAKSTFFHQGGFSLFSLEEQNVTIEGSAQYMGAFCLKPFSSQGLSNKATGYFHIGHSRPILLIKNNRG